MRHDDATSRNCMFRHYVPLLSNKHLPVSVRKVWGLRLVLTCNVFVRFFVSLVICEKMCEKTIQDTSVFFSKKVYFCVFVLPVLYVVMNEEHWLYHPSDNKETLMMKIWTLS